MPQVSLYLDNEVFAIVQKAAKKEKISVSKFVAERIKKDVKKNWSQDWTNLAGSITDDSFTIAASPKAEYDTNREEL